MFSNHVIQSTNEPTFYVHPGIITEVTKIADKPLDKYMKAFNFGLSQDDIEEAVEMTLSGITELLENEVTIQVSKIVNTKRGAKHPN
ncbi:MAG: hypothetical protein WA125_05445 [Desulfosporosinus sp.]